MREYITASNAYELSKTEGWKYSFFDFIDEFNRSDALIRRAIIKNEPKFELSQESALLKSIVMELCHCHDIEVPEWAEKRHWLNQPWFISGFKSLYATALIESPYSFRQNNIFVLENFLSRA